VRALAPFIAGTSGWRYRNYLPYGAVGTGLWAAAFCLLGYFLSQHINDAVHIAGRVGFWLGAAAAVLVGAVLAVRWLRRADARRRRRAAMATLIAVTVAGVGASVALAFVVGSHPAATGLDSDAFHAAGDIRTGWLTTLAKGVTYLGSGVVTVGVALAAAAVLAWLRRWRELVVLVVAVLLTVLAVDAMKSIVDRPRPPGSLVHTTRPAYPSGHSAHAAIWAWLAAVAAVRMRPAPGAALVAGGVAILILVGLTRVYLRAHFFTDVIGGWGVGAAAFAGAAVVAGLLVARVSHNQRDADPAG
jgi:undecaprenyl-diphosphatase